MTTKRILRTPSRYRYEDIAPLPDPPRVPDMQQNRHMARFREEQAARRSTEARLLELEEELRRRQAEE